MPTSVVAAVTAAAFSYANATAFTIAGYALTSGQTALLVGAGVFALNTAASMLGKQRPPTNDFLPSGMADRTLTVKAAASPRQVVYGETRVGGVIVFADTTGGNGILHLVVPFAGHEVNAFVDCYFNARLVTRDDSGVVPISNGFYTATTTKLLYHLGAAAQTYDTVLETAVGAKWGSSHRLRGVAYVYFALTNNTEYGGSPPSIAISVQGRLVYDPRTATTIWSNNAALCLSDYLTASFGLAAVYASEIDETALIAAANICDEMVALEAASTFTVVAATDVVTLATSSPGIRTGQQVVLTTTGTLPAGLALATTYFWIQTTATTGKLATTQANAFAGTQIDITDAGTGTHTLTRIYEDTVTVPTISQTVTANAGTDVVSLTTNEFDLRTADRIRFTTTGTLPAPLALATTYYWIRTATTNDAGKVATTAANALAGTAIDITDAGTGTHTMTRRDRLDRTTKNARLKTGDIVHIANTGGALPAGLVAATDYYVGDIRDQHPISRTDTAIGDTFKVATSLANARAGTWIDITDAGTGTQKIRRKKEPRYTCDGAFTLDADPETIITQLLSAMGGRAVQVGGKWFIYAAAYLASSLTLTQSDFRGPISVQTRVSMRENFNGVRGTYVEPYLNHQPTDFFSITSATYEAQDNAEQRLFDISLPFTASGSMASRLAKIELNRGRQQISMSAPCKLLALQVVPPDTVSITYSRYSWTAKTFELVGLSFAVDKGDNDAPYLGVDLALRETASTVYDWTANEA